MSIVQGLTTSFKYQILLGQHDLSTDTLKMALYTANADMNADTTVYTTSGEVSSTGTGYTAGGVSLTSITVQYSGTTAYVSFANPSWTGVNFTARCALVYNSSKSNKSIAVVDFGSDKTFSGNVTIQMPANTATSAIIRIGY
jgi:hypothetical protein